MYEKNGMPVETGAVVQRPDYRGEVMELLRGNLTPKLLRERLLTYHDKDIAAAMEQMSAEERRKLSSILTAEDLARILEYAQNLPEYLDELGIRKRMRVLRYLEPAAAVAYLRQTDRENRRMLLELMDESFKAKIDFFSAYEEEEIGSKMTPNFISIRAGSSVKEAMHALIAQAAEHDNISALYVLDQEGALVGAIDLKDLITAREGTDLEQITMTACPYVYASERIEDCIVRLKDYSEDSIPVLDGENQLRGVLVSQEITELMEDYLGEDYARLAGLSAEEDLNEPVIKSVGKRLPWLMVLLGLGLLVSSVVGAFEHVVAHLTLIVCFQSLILDMAGNVGTQSLAVTIRVLMDEQLGTKQKLRLISKEARVGLVNGILLGVLSFVCIGGYIVLLKGQSASQAFAISLCTGLALLVSILLSSVMGTVIPMLFKKMKVDPAVASGPLITTINDLVAVVSYYGLAWLLLISVLGM